MSIFIVTFLIMILAVAAMAVGVMAGRAPIAGSCGGLGNFGQECIAGCDKPCPKRAEAEAEESNN